jgi:hypothetical protein
VEGIEDEQNGQNAERHDKAPAKVRERVGVEPPASTSGLCGSGCELLESRHRWERAG